MKVPMLFEGKAVIVGVICLLLTHLFLYVWVDDRPSMEVWDDEYGYRNVPVGDHPWPLGERLLAYLFMVSLGLGGTWLWLKVQESIRKKREPTAIEKLVAKSKYEQAQYRAPAPGQARPTGDPGGRRGGPPGRPEVEGAEREGKSGYLIGFCDSVFPD